MTRATLIAWRRLIRIATREGWSAKRLDEELAGIGESRR